MTYRKINNTIWKYPLLAIFVVVVVLLLLAVYSIIIKEAVYTSRFDCQALEKCECGLKQAQIDRLKYSKEWVCARPLPRACIFNPQGDRKAVKSILFSKSLPDKTVSTKFDLCSGDVITGDEIIKKLNHQNISDVVDTLNKIDFLHISDRIFSEPGYKGLEYFVTVEYKSEIGATSLETFSRTASCNNKCSDDMKRIINILNLQIDN